MCDQAFLIAESRLAEQIRLIALAKDKAGVHLSAQHALHDFFI